MPIPFNQPIPIQDSMKFKLPNNKYSDNTLITQVLVNGSCGTQFCLLPPIYQNEMQTAQSVRVSTFLASALKSRCTVINLDENGYSISYQEYVYYAIINVFKQYYCGCC